MDLRSGSERQEVRSATLHIHETLCLPDVGDCSLPAIGSYLIILSSDIPTDLSRQTSSLLPDTRQSAYNVRYELEHCASTPYHQQPPIYGDTRRRDTPALPRNRHNTIRRALKWTHNLNAPFRNHPQRAWRLMRQQTKPGGDPPPAPIPTARLNSPILRKTPFQKIRLKMSREMAHRNHCRTAYRMACTRANDGLREGLRMRQTGTRGATAHQARLGMAGKRA